MTRFQAQCSHRALSGSVAQRLLEKPVWQLWQWFHVNDCIASSTTPWPRHFGMVHHAVAMVLRHAQPARSAPKSVRSEGIAAVDLATGAITGDRHITSASKPMRRVRTIPARGARLHRTSGHVRLHGRKGLDSAQRTAPLPWHLPAQSAAPYARVLIRCMQEWRSVNACGRGHGFT